MNNFGNKEIYEMVGKTTDHKTLRDHLILMKT